MGYKPTSISDLVDRDNLGLEAACGATLIGCVDWLWANGFLGLLAHKGW